MFRREREVQLYSLFNLGIRLGVNVQGHAPTTIPLQKKFISHRSGGWVGHQGRSGPVGNNSHSAGFDPRTVQPVASCYTVCAIPAC